jgi:tight adherence protein B
VLSAPLDARGAWIWVALCLASSIGCWPASPARNRLAALLGRPGACERPVRRLLRWSTAEPRRAAVVLSGASLVGGLLGGPGGAVASGIAAGVGYHRWRSSALRRRHTEEVAALLDAVGVLAAELRAGAHPATAAAAASAGTRAVHRVFRAVAAGAALGAEIPTLLARHTGAEPAIADELRRVAAAWALAERHGAALAELMEAVRADLDVRLRLAGQIKAQLAGPRASSSVLAGLPVLGVLLGEGIGAGPWHILTGTPAGQALLVLGTGLACAGILWSGRITARAVPR